MQTGTFATLNDFLGYLESVIPKNITGASVKRKTRWLKGDDLSSYTGIELIVAIKYRSQNTREWETTISAHFRPEPQWAYVDTEERTTEILDEDRYTGTEDGEEVEFYDDHDQIDIFLEDGGWQDGCRAIVRALRGSNLPAEVVEELRLLALSAG